MADNRGLRYAGKEPETLSEDDPLAELARIAGEFAPSQARVAGESAKPSYDETFEFDLEAELLRSFGVEQPAATADADNDEPADLPAFLRSRPSGEMPADEPVAEAVPEPEPVAATGGEGRAPEILEEWTDLPAWPAHRPNTAARGREDAPDPSLGTFPADRYAETATEQREPVVEGSPEVDPSRTEAPEVSAAPGDDTWLETALLDDNVDAAHSAHEPIESTGDVPEAYDAEHFAYADEAQADQPVAQDVYADDAAAAEEEFIAQELAIAGEPEDDDPAEGRAAPVPQAGDEEWTTYAADEERFEALNVPAAVEDDPVWQDFERYAVPDRAEQVPLPAAAEEPEPDNQWDIADELERAFAQFDDFRAAPAAVAAPLIAPAPVAEAHQETPEAAWPPAADPAEPLPAEIEAFEPELEIEALPEAPETAAPAEEESFDIDFDFDDLELEMQAAVEDDLLGPEPLDEAIAEIEATSEHAFEAAAEPAAFEPAAEYETEFEPSYEERAYEAADPIPTIDLYWPPVTDAPREAEPAAPAARAAPARDDLIFDVHDVADTTAMVEPVGEIDIPELPVDEDPAARETVDPDLSDLEAEFAEILAAEPAAPVDEAPLEADQPASEKPFTNGHDKSAATVIDFAQYDFADLGRRQPEFATARGEPLAANDYDQGDEDIYFDDVGGADDRPVATAGQKRKWIIAGGAGVLLCGVALATFFLAGGDVVGSGEPPVIAASDEPFKIVPEDRGGRSVPNQDQAVYQQVAGADSAEAANLVSRSEQPVDVVQRTLDPQVLPLEGRPDPDTLAMVAPGDEPALAEAPAAEPAEDPTTEELLRGATEPSTEVAPERFGLEPRRVETLVVRADGTLVPADSVEQEPAEAPATAAEAPTPSERPGGVTPSDPEARLQPAGGSDDVSAPVRSVQTTTLTPGVSPTAGGPAEGESVEQAALADPAAQAGGLVGAEGALNNPGGYVMQIASQPSEEGARQTYQNLLARYGSILGGRQAQIQAAEIPDRGTYYRVRIAGGTREEAVALCEQYQAAGGSCFVAR